ncbi:MAG: hypothetical protein R6V04_12405 [bacterium]
MANNENKRIIFYYFKRRYTPNPIARKGSKGAKRPRGTRIAAVIKVIMMGKTAIHKMNITIIEIICKGIVKINIPVLKISPNNLHAIKIRAKMNSMDKISIIGTPFFYLYE